MNENNLPSDTSTNEIDVADHRLTTHNVNRMSARRAAENLSNRSDSFAAGGYVHLGPLSVDGGNDFKTRPSMALRSNDQASSPRSNSYGSDEVSSSGSFRSRYPKTVRFKHVETEHGESFFFIGSSCMCLITAT